MFWLVIGCVVFGDGLGIEMAVLCGNDLTVRAWIRVEMSCWDMR